MTFTTFCYHFTIGFTGAFGTVARQSFMLGWHTRTVFNCTVWFAQGFIDATVENALPKAAPEPEPEPELEDTMIEYDLEPLTQEEPKGDVLDEIPPREAFTRRELLARAKAVHFKGYSRLNTDELYEGLAAAGWLV